MAAIPVTFIGVLTYSDLGVGGGPLPPSPGYPAHPIAPGGPPPQVWPGPGYPAHPIAPGGSPPSVSPPIYYPPQIWPQPPVYPAHPIAPGGQPPYPSQGPGFPTPPIYIPITPPPDSGLPHPEHPIYVPVYPTHPIANVPTWDDIKDFLTGNPPARPHPETPVPA